MSYFSWLRNRTSTRSRKWDGFQIRPTSLRFRPQLETLEDRCVPSTLTVHNLADSGTGSLRYDIAQAQSGDTIKFDKNLKGGTITLTSGELDITKNLTINGLGAGLLTVTSTGLTGTYPLYYSTSSRIFEVEGSVTNATLSGMTISNGVGLKSGSSSSSDYYDGTGGGVLNLGTLTINGCNLSNNFAAVYGLFGAGGGGVANFGTLKVTGCTLSNNSTLGNGGGIYNRGTLGVNGGTLSGNSGDSGGGIYNDYAATLTASGCTLSGNTAFGNGSGANDGHAIELGYGGGICNFVDGTATVCSCTLSGNSAYSGGGIYNAEAAAALTVGNSIFRSNSPDNIYGSYTDGGGNTFS